MLKKNDEKINGFLLMIELPLLLFAMSYYSFGSTCTRLKTSEKIWDLLFSSGLRTVIEQKKTAFIEVFYISRNFSSPLNEVVFEKHFFFNTLPSYDYLFSSNFDRNYNRVLSVKNSRSLA